MTVAALWPLDPSIAYLNHGSFGACPYPVLAAQTALRLDMEREPVDFLSASLQRRLDEARAVLAAFLRADAEDLVFVPNATTGVNAVLRSLDLARGDELLVTTHTYQACRKAIDFMAERSGARVVVAALPFPCEGSEAIVAAVMQAASPRTRLALIDHVTSPTALVLPVGRIVRELAARGIDTLVDGAHAPGMVPLALAELGAAYYTGNAHKWLCAPKGAAFLHVRRDHQAQLHPAVVSHGYGAGFRAEFDWTGTQDPTAYLSIPEALRFMESLSPAGWPGVMASNRALVLGAREILLESFAERPPCPEDMIGSMASVPLPPAAPGSPAQGLDMPGLHDWLRVRGIETWLHPHPLPLLRLSAQQYNTPEQYRSLAALLAEALHGR